MPHAVDSTAAQDERDDDLISQLLNPNPNEQPHIDFNGPLGTSALPDAIDFEDIEISDEEDDLADEFPSDSRPNDVQSDGLDGFLSDAQGDTHEQQNGDDLFGDDGAEDDGLEDLFGDDSMAEDDPKPTIKRESPMSGQEVFVKRPTLPSFNFKPAALPSRTAEDLAVKAPLKKTEPEIVIPETAEEREQRLLFEQARAGAGIHAPPETDEELLKVIWPDFSREEIPRWQEFFPQKRAHYLVKQPLKPPKPIQPTKVNLELEVDQERLFRNTTGTHLGKRTREEAEEHGIWVITDKPSQETTIDHSLDVEELDDDEMIGGLSVGDLRVLCEDWDANSAHDTDDDDTFRMLVIKPEVDDDRTTKRRKVEARDIIQQVSKSIDNLPQLDDPASITAKLARRPLLDINDPNLLLDFETAPASHRKPKWEDAKRSGAGNFTKQVQARWNISNDKEYDLLKENQSHRVRSNLTKVEIKHSMPAQKLQYPFYKVALSNREARSYHRPAMHFKENQAIRFEKLGRVKRHTLKDKPVEEVFAEAKDMSLNDNGSMLLLEYSEEAPTVLSGFGMNSRLVNYYRRTDADDTSRPKGQIGETHVLLPQDQSPFSTFGFVDPGKSCPTIHNEMYRAPIFKHEAKKTDFLVVRSNTGVNGPQWYLRTIENLHVVGQQFPYVEVPGTHSRKVTDASKTRIKMLSFRIYRHNEQRGARKPWLSHDMIIKHAPGTDIPQNRSKMKEWMQYDSETKSWYPRKGEGVPDEATVRSWITPEQLCLLDSMQVGHRHLLDAGYINDDDEGDEKEGQSIEEQLAPWQITKNFLKACQGNAMVALHGDGDPTGRGEAFNFLKTSMKGGYKAIGQSANDAMDVARQAELGGHKYNVATQNRLYNDNIRRIWDLQQASLQSTIEHSDVEDDVDTDMQGVEDRSAYPGATPRSIVGTPAGMTSRSRIDDDSASQFSKFSDARNSNKVLRITRVVNKYGSPETETTIVTDPKVIKEYIRRRKQQELAALSLDALQPTGNAEFDAAAKNKLEEELTRLQRNRERRHVREKQKNRKSGSFLGGDAGADDDEDGDGDGGPPGGGGGTGSGKRGRGNKNAGGTQRKCANCGQVGHIKTNKKLCPMLNGQWAAEQGEKMMEGAGGGGGMV